MAYGGDTLYPNFTKNAAGYGNYKGTDGKGDTFSSTAAPAVCGATFGANIDYFRQKNIYDMAGNLWEWTMETMNTNSMNVQRGGYYNISASERPAAYRSAANISANGFGFRLALYVK